MSQEIIKLVLELLALVWQAESPAIKALADAKLQDLAAQYPAEAAFFAEVQKLVDAA